jgi:peptidoglycan/LPS O-acetylase OafA/YrhL
VTSAPDAAVVASGGERWRALDGLRGIAAVIVLIHHGLLTLGSFAEPYYVAERPDAFTPQWWVAWTPFHLLWEGTGSVLVFFVLSGFVLTLAVVRTPGFSWAAYYPARIVRLMVPVWAAVCFAVVLIILVPRTPDVMSIWLQRRVSDVSAENVWQALTLSAGSGPYLVSPLWSLHYEVVFSLLLPLFILGVTLSRRWPIVPILVGIGAIALSGMEQARPGAQYAMFLFGVLLAVHRERLTAEAARFSARPSSRILWPLMLAIGLMLLVWRWITPPADLGRWSGLAELPPSIGAVVIVVVCAHWRGVDRVLTLRPVLWLGTMSFSLYLVHEPIVITASYLFPEEFRYPALVVGYVVSFVAAWLFWLAVERPAHRLSRRVGSWTARRATRRPGSRAAEIR